jgi:hypothetical protein
VTTFKDIEPTNDNYQDNSLWVVKDEDQAVRLDNNGFRVLVLNQNPSDKEKDLLKRCDVTLIYKADDDGRDFATWAIPLLQELAGKIRLEVLTPKGEAQINYSDPKTFEYELLAALELDDSEYERERKKIANRLKIRVNWIDQKRKKFKKETAEENNDVVEILQPHPDPVDGSALLAQMVDIIQHHIILPEGTPVPIAVWCLLTYCFDQFRILPILGVLSPQPRCGKSTLLEIIHGFTCRHILASGISSAAVFRTVEKYRPTLIIDEADTFLKGSEEMRGVINSGHMRTSAFIIRCDGEDNEPRRFSTWSPKVIAAIGKLPLTIDDRSIIIHMKRKAQGERCDRLSISFEDDMKGIRRRCLRWAEDNAEELSKKVFSIKISGNDRASDNWEPLATIAGVIGEGWLERLTESAKLIADVEDEREDLSLMLLADIHTFIHNKKIVFTDRVFSTDLKNSLNQLEERPWEDFNRGAGITTRQIAKYLSNYKIKSKKIRIGSESKRGYFFKCFEDAFNRYIPGGEGVPAGTQEQSNDNNGLENNYSGTRNNCVPVDKRPKQLKLNECSFVPFGKGGRGEGISNGADEVII